MLVKLGNEATSSTIQLSLPLGWPRQSMDEATMQVDLVPPGSYSVHVHVTSHLHVGWALAQG